MLEYAFIFAVAIMLANWHGKSISQSTNMTQTSDFCHMYTTPIALNRKYLRNFTLDYEFSIQGMLKYAFISVVAVMLANWHGKSISQSTSMTQTLYKCNCIIFIVCEMFFPC